MFDITSWVREKIFRRPMLIPSIAWEELSEKKTTKMGYFLLICMFFAIMGTAQWSLSIIKDIPDRPTETPYCVTEMLSAFGEQESYNYDYYQYRYDNCDLISHSNPVYDYTAVYAPLLPKYNLIVSYRKQLSDLQSDYDAFQSKYRNSQRDYNTSLLEDIAVTPKKVYNTELNQKIITDNLKQEALFESQIKDLKTKITEIIWANQVGVRLLKDYHEQSLDAYNNAYLWFKIVRAFLSLLFIGITFWLLYKFYVRYKLQNSPHTIIFSVATFAYWLILLQLLLFFLWDIIPHTILEYLLGWISIFTPLLFLVQFLWPVIVIGVFWFLVYRIQKRLYSPENILKRFVTDKSCPHCGNAVDMTKPFCPLCSHEIHIHCSHCNELTMKWMPYCSHCGKDLL